MFAVRGTRLTKTGTVQADIQLLRDRDAELYYSQRALKHVQKHIRRLSAEQPDVQWGFFITGASVQASSHQELHSSVATSTVQAVSCTCSVIHKPSLWLSGRQQHSHVEASRRRSSRKFWVQ